MRDEPAELRAAPELRVTGAAHGVRRVRGPERHAPPAGRAGRVLEPERAVPHQGVGLVVEPRAVVGDPQHAALVAPLGAEVEVVGARLVGQGHLDVVAEPEAGAPWQLTRVVLRRVGRGQVQLLGRAELEIQRADVTPFLQVELRGQRHVGIEVRLRALDRELRRVVEAERAARHRVRRPGVDAVELRDLIPQARDGEPAGALVAAGEALIAPADVVRGAREHPGAVRALAGIPDPVEEDAVPEILVALEARRIAVHAAQPAADLELARLLVEQAARGRLGVGRRRRGRLFRRRSRRGLRGRRRWRGRRLRGRLRGGLRTHGRVTASPSPQTRCTSTRRRIWDSRRYRM